MTIIRIGFSGTRHGMTALQIRGAYWTLNRIALTEDQDPESELREVHHGDCTGADAEFHVIATAAGWRTVAHPPLNDRLRAWCKADEVREPKDYLARDRDIASETGVLIAAPASPVPVRGSGTWATIGYANQLRRPVWLCLPDGRVIPHYRAEAAS